MRPQRGSFNSNSDAIVQIYNTELSPVFRIAALEEKSSQSNGEKVEVLKKRLQKKAEEIINLENRSVLCLW